MGKTGVDQPFQSRILYDAIRAIYEGMNSGVDPQSLAREQSSFLRNATVRGTFVMPRPAYRKISLSGSSDLVSASLAAILGGAQVFQCACYYRAISGTQSVMLSVSGRLFQFAISGTQAIVTELTTPSLRQSSFAPQTWMWQAERFLIYNDGSSLPLFYDGVSARRSRGAQSLTVGTTNLDFTAPAIGNSVTIRLAGVYTGPVPATIFVNGLTTAEYEVTASTPPAGSSDYQLTLKNLWNGSNETVPVGTHLIQADGYYGFCTVATPTSTIQVTNPLNGHVDNYQQAVLPCTADATGSVGNVITLQRPDGTTITTSASIQAGTATTVTVAWLSATNITIPAGTLIAQNNNTYTVQATTVATFVDPVPGTSVSAVQIDNALTIPVGSYLIIGLPGIGSAQVQVTQSLTGASTNWTLTAINLNQTAGTVNSQPLPLKMNVNELPAGRMGTYGLGRNWVSLTDGQTFIASDIVDGASGTTPYNGDDAVLSVTENDFLAGGGTFRVPGAVGQITAMIFTAQMDTSLGQGPLAVATENIVFSCQTPLDRTTWQDVTNPILTESIISNGSVSHYATINANSDVIMRSKDGIRSMIYSRRDFDKWRNGPISREVDFINSDNPQLLSFASAIDFDNRLLMTTGPTQTGFGVVHSGIIALNFDPISSLKGAAPACYDGLWDAPAGGVLQIVTGQFDGQERAFAVCVSKDGSALELWEIMRTDDPQYQDDSGPIVWEMESGALNFYENDPRKRDYMTLKDGELRIDLMNKTYGRNGALITTPHQVKFEAFYKGDQDDAWQPWYTTTQTFPDPSNQPSDDPGYRSFIGFGEPDPLPSDPVNDSPMRDFTTMQFRIRITGHCRLLSARFKANTTPIPDFAAPTQPT